MNCEQVEELLSAHLDNALASEECVGVTAHLEGCRQCNRVLADFRRFDALLVQLPRVSPSPALRDKIFSSPEYLELTGTFDATRSTIGQYRLPVVPTRGEVRRDSPGRPHLVAIPGGRSAEAQKLEGPLGSAYVSPSSPLHVAAPRGLKRAWVLQAMRVAIAVAILLTIGVGGLIGRNLWLQQAKTVSINDVVTGPQQQVPFPVGMRFVFLRDGALWSAPASGNTKAIHLTPKTVTVGATWVVSPALPGLSAGDKLAYVDLQHALIHTIHSDGQGDTAVQQPLLKAGVEPSSLWDTDTGMAILSSLTWSKDGSMLAFVGDPSGTGQTNLYILSLETGSVQMVPLPVKGSASRPTWSPDGVRLAFELTHDSIVSIVEYNTQNHGLLTDDVSHLGGSADTVLTLDWSPNTDEPTLTWSLGAIGHVHSLWLRHVGGGTTGPQQLTTGDYVQAVYNRTGHDGVGSWLLVNSVAGRRGDLWYVDVISTSKLIALTAGKQVGFTGWSPNGIQVDYLDNISAGVGTLHTVNVATGIDTLIATGVANEPAPKWSVDSQQLVYSTGTQTFIVNLAADKKFLLLKLQGPASAFAWSASSPDQLLVALNDNQQGIYLVDVKHNTSLRLDTLGINASIRWTQIP